MARALQQALAAAAASDAEAFVEAAAQLHRLDLEQVGRVQAVMTRCLLEDSHPGGLDGEDVRAALERCVGDAAAWFPGLSGDALIAVFTSALGMFEPDEDNQVAAATMVSHASLVIADLAKSCGLPVEPYLDAAIEEIRRAETMELP
ncbi:MAG: hypothetical protein QOK10_3443 [Pseudonocardiales bacterium]|jgi:hypothetical protein|nr:hypothetical protein [Pseudonocardiales bacterium]